jgi:hypothetical protein
LVDGRIAATGVVFDTNAVGSLNPNIGVLVVGSDGCLEPGCTGITQYITGTFEPFSNSSQLPQLLCSPNPASDFTSVKLPSEIGPTLHMQILRAYNSKGILIADMPWIEGSREYQVDVKGWSQGVYQLLFCVDRRPLFSGKIIVQH